MSIVRVRKTENFSIISNQPINDSELPWECRGVLIYLLSKPDSWEVNVNHLIKQGPGGRDRMYRILGDLEECGYITRTNERTDDGTYQRVVYTVREQPLPEKPDTDKPDTENTDAYKRLKEVKTEKEPSSGPGGPDVDLFGEKTDPPKQKRKLSQSQLRLKRLQELFCEESNLPSPPLNTQRDKKAFGVRWAKPLREIISMCEEDMDKACSLVEDSVQHMRENNLTFDAPQSIIKTARSIYAQEYSEGGKHKTIRTDDGGYHF